MSQLHDCRDAFAATLEELAAADPRIVAVCNDSVGSSKLGGFRARFPARLVNVGIAEQDMVGVAAGLANGGKIPFVCGASCFITGRGMEQVKVDVAYARNNVKLCGISSGFAYGELGPTHHSVEDMAWTRAIAGLTVIVPADDVETAQAVRAAAALEGPMFLRLSRFPVPSLHGPEYHFNVGRASCLREGHDITLIANGIVSCRALQAASVLAERGIGARVLNMSTVSPIDVEAIVAAALETGAIVTAEEHTIRGGLGGAVAEVLALHAPAPMRMLGLPGTFAPIGPVTYLLEHFGLTAASIAQAAEELLTRKARR